jgi:pyruvate-formate lyase-activating enzyme
MTCVEFQKLMPNIIDSNLSAQHRVHLQSCPACSDTVADLKYIAQQAKLLVSLEAPPERVWRNISSSLERQRSGRTSCARPEPARLAVACRRF